jgi:hypothetical protein
MFKKFGISDERKITFGDKIIEIIKSKFYKGEYGIKGYGIKLLP